MNKFLNLAIIPARGGSKRIPRKNLKSFLGKPIIAYSIEAAIKSNLFKEVMVSTDDAEIADITIKYGAKVPFMRSNETSDDFATLAEVVEEVKKYYILRNEIYTNICCILPTAPLITIDNLKEGFNLLIQKNADSVRPVARYSYPVQRAFRLINNKTEFIYPEYRTTRTQDLEPTFHDAGQFYWMKFDPGLNGSKRLGFEIPQMLVQDLDTLEDWLMAEVKYKIHNKLI